MSFVLEGLVLPYFLSLEVSRYVYIIYIYILIILLYIYDVGLGCDLVECQFELNRQQPMHIYLDIFTMIFLGTHEITLDISLCTSSLPY